MLSRARCLGFAVLALLAPAVCHAAGQWNGQDLLHVPMSWCIIQGSQADVSPNVAGDTVTDDLIWRRHERPTDSIYVNQAGISFRSAINDAWNVLDFPRIPDPDTTLGIPGDMRGEDVNAFGAEFNQMLVDCDAAWAAMGRAGIGITAINANLFHNAAGTYVGVIGWGGCVEDTANPGFCVNPWDGQIAVVDNHYLHPSVPNRIFPDGSGQFVLTDPMDQLVGHELGHALSLPHRNNVTALMNPSPVDNVGGDSQSDNITLINTEVTAVRNMAMVANGLEIDPPNVFLPGSVVAVTQVDGKRREKLPRERDLAALRVTLDTKAGVVSFGQRLLGLVPAKSRATQSHWYLIDSDGPERGADARALRKVGVPATRFTGADVVIRADVRGRSVKGAAWQLRRGQLVKLRGVRFRLLALVMHPHFADVKGGERPKLTDSRRGFPIYHVVTATLPAPAAGVALNKTVNVHAVVADAKGKLIDELDVEDARRGTPFRLDYPSFPHCFPQGTAEPGQRVRVDIENLKPNRPFHALLGPRLVGRGTTDGRGNGSIDLEIPRDTTRGLHLVTIGNDRTALTADCTVAVGRQ